MEQTDVLSGSLKAIALPTLMQMIGQDRKSGLLKLRNQEKGYVITFSEGQIVLAKQLDQSNMEFSLKFLVRRAVLDEKQAIEVRNRQTSTMKEIEACIIDTKIADLATLKKAWQLETDEALYDMLSWKEGEYKFAPGEVEFNHKLHEAQGVDGILMEGMRINDEMPRLLKNLGSLDRVPTKKINDDELTAAHVKKLNSLPEKQQTTYKHIDNIRSIDEIGYRTGLGKFETAHAISGLADNKIISLVDKELVGDSGEQMAMKEHSRFRQVFVSLGMVFLVFALALTAARLAGFSIRDVIRPPKKNLVHRNWRQTYLSTNQLKRLNNAIEIFRLENNRYPDSLAELVDSKLLHHSDLTFPFQREYYYKKMEDGSYLILKPVE
jgi:Domain of unknown function (DUF4388)